MSDCARRLASALGSALEKATWLVWREGHLAQLVFPDIGASVELVA